MQDQLPPARAATLVERDGKRRLVQRESPSYGIGVYTKARGGLVRHQFARRRQLTRLRAWRWRNHATGFAARGGKLEAEDVLARGDVNRSVAVASEATPVLKGRTGPVNSAVFAPDGGRIVTASYDNTARLWD